MTNNRSIELPTHETLGRHIGTVIDMAIARAKKHGCDVTFRFNGINMRVTPLSCQADQLQIFNMTVSELQRKAG